MEKKQRISIWYELIDSILMFLYIFFFFTDLIAITCNVYSSPILDIIMVLNFELIIQTFLAGWWYGVVGHLASCNGNEHFCHCHDNGKEQNTLASCYYYFVTICVCN